MFEKINYELEEKFINLINKYKNEIDNKFDNLSKEESEKFNKLIGNKKSSRKN
jgi:hypothetical protein